MKRSEMISEIENFLDSEEYAPGHIKNDLFLAEKLLSFLEEVGMQPPFGSRTVERNIVDKWSVDTGKIEIIRVVESQWDETL